MKGAELLFGGKERLELLLNTFKKLLDSNEELILFCIADEYTVNVTNIFKKLSISKYFGSIIEDEQTKEVSKYNHILGIDSNIVTDTGNKKHLVLLKLMKYLDRHHENVLYISNNKDDTDHLNSINVCYTYYCQNFGLTSADIDKIVETYF